MWGYARDQQRRPEWLVLRWTSYNNHSYWAEQERPMVEFWGLHRMHFYDSLSDHPQYHTDRHLQAGTAPRTVIPNRPKKARNAEWTPPLRSQWQCQDLQQQAARTLMLQQSTYLCAECK